MRGTGRFTVWRFLAPARRYRRWRRVALPWIAGTFSASANSGSRLAIRSASSIRLCAFALLG
jgi:hypothetical protein